MRSGVFTSLAHNALLQIAKLFLTLTQSRQQALIQTRKMFFNLSSHGTRISKTESTHHISKNGNGKDDQHQRSSQLRATRFALQQLLAVAATRSLHQKKVITDSSRQNRTLRKRFVTGRIRSNNVSFICSIHLLYQLIATITGDVNKQSPSSGNCYPVSTPGTPPACPRRLQSVPSNVSKPSNANASTRIHCQKSLLTFQLAISQLPLVFQRFRGGDIVTQQNP